VGTCVVNELCELYVTHYRIRVFIAECNLLIQLKNTYLQINIFMKLLFIHLFIYFEEMALEIFHVIQIPAAIHIFLVLP